MFEFVTPQSRAERLMSRIIPPDSKPPSYRTRSVYRARHACINIVNCLMYAFRNNEREMQVKGGAGKLSDYR